MNQEERIQELERQISELKRMKAASPIEESTQSTSSSLKIIFFVFLGFFGIAALVYWGFHESLSGYIKAEGSLVGNWSVPSSECTSGHAFVPSFFGVEIHGPEKESPKIQVQVISPKKSNIFVWGNKSDEPVLFTRETCKLFDVEVNWGGAKVNDVKTVEGHVHVECVLPSGDQLFADTNFSNCY